MHRRRKYGVKEAMEEHPVSLFVFDVLYSDGADYTLKPYLTRHEKLKQMIEENVRIKTATSLIINKVEDMERFFERSVEKGCEGLICKSIAIESVYQAGARGWMWIKYKREYSSEMTDTNDLTIVGAFYGRGKRAGTYGAMLLAAYNSEKDTFETATKCGTGFTDEDLQKLPKMMKKYRIPHKHPRVESLIKADVWFEPAVVIEVLAAEITLSQVHTCGKNTFRKGSGFALRFPRFTGKYRLDKSAEDATTSHEIMEMYKSQLKKLNAN